MKTLGIVGTGLAGKSTLLDHIRQHPASDDRTEDVYAVIIALPTAPISFAAVLDGAGNEFGQQFIVAEMADVLVFVLDHNSSDSETDVDSARLDEHEYFLSQVRSYFINRKLKKRLHTHFVLNKMDLWKSVTGHADLNDWFSHQVEEWKKANLGERVSSAFHSNRSADSVSNFVQQILRGLTDEDKR